MNPQILWQELELIKKKLGELQQLTGNLEAEIRAASGGHTPAPKPPPHQTPPQGIPVRPGKAFPTSHAKPPESLETTIGIRWLVVTGVIAVIIAIGFGVRIAIERGWFTEELRCASACLMAARWLL